MEGAYCNTLIGGTSKQPLVVEIGAPGVKYDSVRVGGIDLFELRKRVEQLEKDNERLNELVEALWLHPGMPGAPTRFSEQ